MAAGLPVPDTDPALPAAVLRELQPAETYLMSYPLAVVLAVLPWPGVLAALLPLPYAVNVLRFRDVRDDDCERANAGWRAFLWLNLVTGFLVTMLLLADALT